MYKHDLINLKILCSQLYVARKINDFNTMFMRVHALCLLWFFTHVLMPFIPKLFNRKYYYLQKIFVCIFMYLT